MCHRIETVTKRVTAAAVVGPQGRVVIPAPVRKSLKIAAGTRLTFFVEGDRVSLQTRESALAELRRLFSDTGDTSTSLSEELIVERREEARRELEWMGE